MEVCVIGAGMSGLVMAKKLLDHSLVPVVFEQTNEIGGLWNYRPSDCHSCYESLHTNTSRPGTQFSDFAMDPDVYPNKMSHVLVHNYFQEYSKEFGIMEYITFNAKVLNLCENEEHTIEENRWDVDVDIDGKIYKYTFEAVAICNGHHFSEIWPTSNDIPGLDTFSGVQIHSHNYRMNEFTTNKTVIVAGLSISGGDIGGDIEDVTRQCIYSSRRYGTGIKKILKDKAYLENGVIVKHVDIIIWCWGYRYEYPFLEKGFLEIQENPSRISLFQRVFPINKPGIISDCTKLKYRYSPDRYTYS
eukprot:TRINITY_DN3495_c0_g1_i1.p1 TRINITY_DN3495_c0_g1~~TRINITY_DN3495_c0_g1_i1.p1  ORF type:complete len:302 (-),score=47.21 TRINITY_DN3495_c0_g1_i1:225-1130(-)